MKKTMKFSAVAVLLSAIMIVSNLNAQVRIGGTAKLNEAAVLDLNATDAATGTKGLALPRVNLSSHTAQLQSGVPNLNGMLVYNTDATLGAGIYYWNGSNWLKMMDGSSGEITADMIADKSITLDKIFTQGADSGMYAVSNGRNWFAGLPVITADTTSRIAWVMSTPQPVTWTMVLDTTLHVKFRPGFAQVITVQGLGARDQCETNGGGWVIAYANTERIYIRSLDNYGVDQNRRIRCYRPSI